MDTLKINDMANTLHSARQNAKAIEQFSANMSEFERSDAYTIQETGIKLREESGEKVIGLKMGLTSKGKREQMNLDAPLYGVLTDVMQVQNKGTYSMTGSIHPKIEPEIAFYIDKELKGEVTREEVLAATSSICGALEILDSRYIGFKYFSMEDVISDNSSSSHYIMGPKLTDFKDIDLKNLKMEMLVNGEVAQSGNSVAISDDPVISVIQLASLLAERGQSIPAGCFVLAGAATAAVNLEVGMEVELKVESLPDVNVRIGA